MIKWFGTWRGTAVAHPEGMIRVARFGCTRIAASLGVLVAAVASIAVPVDPARAQGRVEATYRATLAGIPIGSGSWIIDIGPKQYAGAASGRASGLMRVLASGEGSSSVRGTIKQGRLIPSIFAANIHSHDSYQIHMEMSGGNVKTLKNEPPVVESPDRIPLTEAHRRGIVDTMSALMITVPGKGDVVSGEACQ